MRWSVAVILWLTSLLAFAQEGKLQADFRRESERVAEACKGTGVKGIPGCSIELFTDHPLHIAAGSMSPQNGFALGAAFVAGQNTKNWRMTWDVDAVGSVNGSFRAGGYMKMIHTPPENIHVLTPVPSGTGTTGSASGTKPPSFIHPNTVLNLYAQAISLNKLYYFGLGNDSTLAGQSVFGMTQTIVGVNAIKPVYEWKAIRGLNLALLGELNGRFVSVRGNHGESQPSIGALYTEATAPGLSSQPSMAQFGEGVRINPKFGARFQLNYQGSFQQFAASSDSRHSFLRWTTDFNHTFYLYGYTKSGMVNTDVHGPDECAPLSEKCPPVSHSRNLNGSIGFRVLLSESSTSSINTVPFYFQPTLGGSDINGAMALPSYQDYRFRAPNVFLLRETFEHSIWGPFGFSFLADQGKVAVARSDIDFDNLRDSFAAGLTLRAGGFPMVSLMFAWGGSEGHHNIFNMNSSLLGGSARPSLF
ncbi:hypothetical protein H7849_04740 [Alloacidobacterium dinghuense]|uniref:Uncharacterized protein n=1 Tax=Alloacidobacterium dinghuense TaxID=2763107 RepID=A0A7G8BL55_9BACT|nr:hypothetical protein [Alloacidobacterium dinghuense]QNI33275.1 hypothetical protein H7849_04740 [Alloacidobacterium dinghuense]